MAEWKGTNGTSEDPKSAFSDPPVRNRKNRILGGLGVMAVQSFSRIRANRQDETGSADMAERKVKIWYDPEGDYLEVMFDQKPGYFRETASDQVMEKVDEAGNILGFSVLKVSALKRAPLEVAL
jgi:uncharacterized protein YuzE